MKLKSLITSLVILTIAFITSTSYAQCPWDRVNCAHGCGRFNDANNNGLCDYSEGKTKADTFGTKTVEKKEVAAVEKRNESKQSKRCSGCTHDKCIHSESTESGSNAEASEEDEFKSMDASEVDTTAVSKAELDATTTAEKEKPYSLILISLITFALYAFTWILVKLNKLKLSMHRKIWNVILLCTFLVSCLFGFFLVVQLNYDFVISWYRTVLYWHVQVGIAMTIIAVFHTIWHVKYYVNIFKRKKTPKE